MAHPLSIYLEVYLRRIIVLTQLIQSILFVLIGCRYTIPHVYCHLNLSYFNHNVPTKNPFSIPSAYLCFRTSSVNTANINKWEFLIPNVCLMAIKKELHTYNESATVSIPVIFNIYKKKLYYGNLK